MSRVRGCFGLLSFLFIITMGLSVGCDPDSSSEMGGQDATIDSFLGDTPCRDHADCPDLLPTCIADGDGGGYCANPVGPCEGDPLTDNHACPRDPDSMVRVDSMDASLDAASTDSATDALMGDSQVDAGFADAHIADAMVIEPDAAIPVGPIDPPPGTDGTPEDVDFDWSDVGDTYISRSVPQMDLDWADYPRYGRARVRPESDSEHCVCFDIECATCNRRFCGAALCTYDFNDTHSLTKYHVELTSLEDENQSISFDVNISANPPIQYTDIVDVLDRLERIPAPYWPGLKVITEFGRGIQFLHRSYFNGAAAYGSRSYIDTQTADLPTLIHELGHTLEQYTRLGNEPVLEPQSNILNPIWRNAIRADDNRTSPYGDNNEWEDMAEFARIYALSAIEDSLPILRELSPERYRIWVRILRNGSTISP